MTSLLATATSRTTLRQTPASSNPSIQAGGLCGILSQIRCRIVAGVFEHMWSVTLNTTSTACSSCNRHALWRGGSHLEVAGMIWLRQPSREPACPGFMPAHGRKHKLHVGYVQMHRAFGHAKATIMSIGHTDRVSESVVPVFWELWNPHPLAMLSKPQRLSEAGASLPAQRQPPMACAWRMCRLQGSRQVDAMPIACLPSRSLFRTIPWSDQCGACWEVVYRENPYLLMLAWSDLAMWYASTHPLMCDAP